MKNRARRYFAVNFVLLLMIVCIYLATNAAMLQNVFAQVGQAPIYKGQKNTVTLVISAESDFENAVMAGRYAKEKGLVLTIGFTAEQMQTKPGEIKKLSAMGHEIILQGQIDTGHAAPEEIRTALNREIGAYTQLFSKAPQYYLPYRFQATTLIKKACKEQVLNVVLFSQDSRAVVYKKADAFTQALFSQINKGDFIYLDHTVLSQEVLESLHREIEKSGYKNQNMTQALID
ncbi:MAG: hypothetical protein ACLUR9_10010 [Christensenellales bacterium]